MCIWLDLQTKYGLIRNIPIIKWPALLPFWPSIVISIAEVITENKFRPYPASYAYPDGIVLSSNYWSVWTSKRREFPFLQSIRFLELLKEKTEFRDAIERFNNNSNEYKKWLDPSNLDVLGNRIYGFYFVLKPVFIKPRKKSDWLRVKYSQYYGLQV